MNLIYESIADNPNDDNIIRIITQDTKITLHTSRLDTNIKIQTDLMQMLHTMINFMTLANECDDANENEMDQLMLQHHYLDYQVCLITLVELKIVKCNLKLKKYKLMY